MARLRAEQRSTFKTKRSELVAAYPCVLPSVEPDTAMLSVKPAKNVLREPPVLKKDSNHVTVWSAKSPGSSSSVMCQQLAASS